jgi:hypothetical protein
MKCDPFKQLHRLRVKRRDMALEQVARRQAALLRANEQLATASAAVSEHSTSTVEKEKSGLAQIVGKTLSFRDMMHFQAELALLAQQTEELRGAEKSANDERDAAQLDAEEAAHAFRECHRDVEKLDHLLLKSKQKNLRHHLAALEAGDEHRVRNNLFNLDKPSSSKVS